MDDRDNESKANSRDPLTARVAELENKVSVLEQRLLELQQRSSAPAPVRESVYSGQQPAGNNGLHGYGPVPPGQPLPPSPPSQPYSVPAPPQPKPKTDWEHLIARVWLPRIFIAVLLIGVVWGFTAAVSAGIITEPVRCILGILAAGFMYWQGEAQTRHNRQALGQVLLGGSVAVLVLALFAAHMLYELIPGPLAFVLYVLSIGIGIWTALRHRSQALAVIMMIAGYLVPFLVDSSKPDIWSFTAYETVFSVTMILLAHRYGYRVAYFTAFFVLHIPLLIGTFIGDDENSRYAVMTAVLLQHALLFTLSAFRSGGGKAETAQPVSLFLSFGLTAAWMYGMFGDEDPFIYRLVIAVCAIVYSAAAYRLVKQKSRAAIHLSVATFAWFLWLVHVLEASHIATATLIEGTLAIILGITLKSKLQQLTGGLTYLFGAYCVLMQPLRHIASADTLAWLVLIASVIVLYVFLKRLPEGADDLYKRNKNGLLWVDSVLFLIFLTQVTDVLTRWQSEDVQRLLLSAVWVVYAIAVIVTGVITDKQKVRLAGILFLFITLLKIIFADLPDVSTAVRAILFIGVGGIGVAVSRLFYKRKE